MSWIPTAQLEWSNAICNLAAIPSVSIRVWGFRVLVEELSVSTLACNHKFTMSRLKFTYLHRNTSHGSCYFWAKSLELLPTHVWMVAQVPYNFINIWSNLRASFLWVYSSIYFLEIYWCKWNSITERIPLSFGFFIFFLCASSFLVFRYRS